MTRRPHRFSRVLGVARSSAVPVELDLSVDGQLPESAEVAAYYVVAEALTNVAKHARASQVRVCAQAQGASLHLSIRDDGIVGSQPGKRVRTHRPQRPRRGARRHDGRQKSGRTRDLPRRQDQVRRSVNGVVR